MPSSAKRIISSQPFASTDGANGCSASAKARASAARSGPRIQSLTLRWLERQRFHELTGVASGHVRFCRKRPEKREHCAAIGATHFVDDRVDVLTHLVGLVPHLYWFGQQPAHARAPDLATPTADWQEARHAILSRLSRRRVETAAGRAT